MQYKHMSLNTQREQGPLMKLSVPESLKNVGESLSLR